MSDYYIAACVFTSRYQKISALIRGYVQGRRGIDVVRCCVPDYKVKEFTGKMDGGHRNAWESIPHCADFRPGDTVCVICPNCAAILEETKPGVKVRSLWELILGDESFQYHDYRGEAVSVQDCWRSRENGAQQAAVRELLGKMNFRMTELDENHGETDFCGVSLLRPAPPRNLRLAPVRFVENAAGKFIPHDADEQRRIMEAHCARIPTEKVVAYCHYCKEGLDVGGANARHLAELLFDPQEWA